MNKKSLTLFLILLTLSMLTLTACSTLNKNDLRRNYTYELSNITNQSVFTNQEKLESCISSIEDEVCFIKTIKGKCQYENNNLYCILPGEILSENQTNVTY